MTATTTFTPPPAPFEQEVKHPTTLAVDQARAALSEATSVVQDKTEALGALSAQYRAAVVAHDGDAMARLHRELDDTVQHILAAKIGVASARVALLTAEVADAERAIGVAFADAEAKRQIVIAITEEVHPSERANMGGDPDRVRRYQQACEVNGQAAAVLDAAKDRHVTVAQKRNMANGEVQLMIERVAARARRDTSTMSPAFA